MNRPFKREPQDRYVAEIDDDVAEVRNPSLALLGHHHLDELLVVDLPVTIDVSLADHLVDLLVRELLAQVGHDVTELGGGDETVTVLVEDLERLQDLLLGVGVLHLAGHHSQELREVDGAAAVGVDLRAMPGEKWL